MWRCSAICVIRHCGGSWARGGEKESSRSFPGPTPSRIFLLPMSMQLMEVNRCASSVHIESLQIGSGHAKRQKHSGPNPMIEEGKPARLTVCLRSGEGRKVDVSSRIPK